MADNRRKCIIGYAETFFDGKPYGTQPDYDRTVYCCDKMREKSRLKDDDIFNYNHPFQLVKLGDLKFMFDRSTEANFCSFCGATIEVKKTAEIKLIERKKMVDDGYDEQLIRAFA